MATWIRDDDDGSYFEIRRDRLAGGEIYGNMT